MSFIRFGNVAHLVIYNPELQVGCFPCVCTKSTRSYFTRPSFYGSVCCVTNTPQQHSLWRFLSKEFATFSHIKVNGFGRIVSLSFLLSLVIDVSVLIS